MSSETPDGYHGIRPRVVLLIALAVIVAAVVAVAILSSLAPAVNQARHAVSNSASEVMQGQVDPAVKAQEASARRSCQSFVDAARIYALSAGMSLPEVAGELRNGTLSISQLAFTPPPAVIVQVLMPGPPGGVAISLGAAQCYWTPGQGIDIRISTSDLWALD